MEGSSAVLQHVCLRALAIDSLTDWNVTKRPVFTVISVYPQALGQSSFYSISKLAMLGRCAQL